MIKQGQSFLRPSGPSQNQDLLRLHIILTDPLQDNRVILVPLSSWTNNLCDNSCVLDKGDHPFIRHKSWIMYRKTFFCPCSDIISGLKSGLFIQEADLSAPVLLRICNGLLASRYTRADYKKYVLSLPQWP